MKHNNIRVVLAEDNEKVRKGIRKLLNQVDDIEVIGEAEDGMETLRLVDTLLPDILMLDVEMPILNGIEVARRLNKKQYKTRILVLSAYNDPGYIHEILRLGASGYLIKDEAPERILEAIRGTAQRETGLTNPHAKTRGKKDN